MPPLFSGWTWPAVCEVCERWPAQPVCAACLHDHGRERRRCPGCALPLAPGLGLCIRCVERPDRPLAQVQARVDYAYPWVDLIAQFKFQRQTAWARTLAQLMAEPDSTQQLLASADLIAPIPLAPSRLRERGYNQSWELIKHLRRNGAAGTDACPDLLLRTETARLQHDLPRAERFAHARRALSVNPTHHAALRQAHVLLVDDVMTTGATLDAAAQALLDAGAAQVSALVFARTPPPPDAARPEPDDTDGME